jgi:putative membrane protein
MKVLLDMAVAFLNDPFSQHRYGMDPWTWEWGFHMGWFFLIIMAAFWIAVILAIIFLIRWFVTSGRPGDRVARQQDSALEILRIRYAKGEINKEEFDEKKKDLGYS